MENDTQRIIDEVRSMSNEIRRINDAVRRASDLFLRVNERRRPSSTERVNNMEKNWEAKTVMEELIKSLLEIHDQEDFNALVKYYGATEELFDLCMDMGCGSTSAAFQPVKGTEARSTETVLWKPELAIYNSAKYEKNTRLLSIPTIIGHNGEEYGLGPSMFEFGPAAENFKCLPTKEDLEKPVIIGPSWWPANQQTRRKVWEVFFKLAVREMFDADMDLPVFQKRNRSNTLLIVAHPAGKNWSKAKNLNSYKELIAKSTGFDKSRIITFSEAKAALRYVSVYRGKKIKIDWKTGIIVIDLGASTIDIAIHRTAKVEDMEEAANEWSLSMAGKEVDALLGNEILEMLFPEEMKAYLSQSKRNAVILPDDAFFKHFGGIILKRTEFQGTRGAFAYHMRLLKETICNDGERTVIIKTSDGEDRSIVITKEMLLSILRQKRFAFNCDPDVAEIMMGRPGLVSGGSWFDYLDKLLTYVIEKAISQVPETPKKLKVIATGGTSNLCGVEDCIVACAERYGIPKDNIIILNKTADYERTVPYGSASYFEPILRNLDRMLAFPDKLYAELEKQYLEIVSKCLAEKFAPFVKQEVGNVIQQWIDLPKPEENWFMNTHTVTELFDLMDKHSIDQAKLNKILAEVNESLRKRETLDEFFAPVKTLVNTFLAEIANTDFTSDFAYPDVVSQIEADVIQEFSIAQLKNNVYLYMPLGSDLIHGTLYLEDNPEIRQGHRKGFYKRYSRLADFTSDLKITFIDILSKKWAVTKEAERLTADIVRSMRADIENAMYMS